jgi:glycosyltransferase involved in cell wall biosynthesis
VSGGGSLRATPLVSCLCVTEGRAAFMPWLLWTFERQTWPRKELVVVDSSPAPLVSRGPEVRVVTAPAGASVPHKRNLALAAARGEIVGWFDDDDWQHPERLTETASAVAAGAAVASVGGAWFVDLLGDGAYAYRAPGGVIFNAAAFSLALARSVRFDERTIVASDAGWLSAVVRAAGGAVHRLRGAPHMFWLCHDDNLSNPRERRPLCFPLAQVRASVGEVAWEGTDAQLAALRGRLADSAARRPLR